MSAVDPRTPCIIGVGTRTWHPDDVGPEGAPEPLVMWEDVARAAERDAHAPNALQQLDSLQVVYCQTWQYDDAPQRIADRLGADPKHRYYSGIGGTTTQKLVDDTARSMLAGDLDLALITSAEALATQRAFKKRGERAAYSFKPDEKRPFPWEAPMHPAEIAHEVFQAWLTFALFDNARRAANSTNLDDYRSGIGRMMAPMTKTAAANPDAWFRAERSADELVTVTPDNRMVGYPYTKYVVSIMDVDMAAALLVATHERADALGVPQDQRVYLRGWCYATDETYVAEHRDLTTSPAMRAASSAALAQANADIDDVAYLDLYSCFASSLHFARDALGITDDENRALTVTGGLPYHGGPGSGYLTHSIATMARVLRDDPGSTGMVSGVGMHMTKHVFGVYSTTPPQDLAAPDEAAVQHRLDTAGAPKAIADEHDGDATVAAYSVVHGRDGGPDWGLLVCDVGPGTRAYAKLLDHDDLAAAESTELVGRTVRLEPQTVAGPMGDARANLARVSD
jgi:acetyl-CoA C-acetyltransferase